MNLVSWRIIEVVWLLGNLFFNISTRLLCSFDNLLFKFNVSLSLVTRELLQNTVDVNNVTYKLYNIKT